MGVNLEIMNKKGQIGGTIVIIVIILFVALGSTAIVKWLTMDKSYIIAILVAVFAYLLIKKKRQ